MIYINLQYPDPPCVRLGDLYKGECFISSSKFRNEYADVYMVLKNQDEKYVNVISLSSGDTRLLHCNSKVVRMVVEINARPMTKADEDQLPF